MHDLERLSLALAGTKDHTRSRDQHSEDVTEIVQILNSGLLGRSETLKTLQSIPEAVYDAWRVR